MIGERSFYYTQEKYLFPAINYVYKNRRNNIIEKLKTERLSVVGDSRNDSPGYSAEFGTYTIMNANSNEIIDFFIAHVSNAGGSSKMELYAFKKVLDYLTLSGLEISTITTD